MGSFSIWHWLIVLAVVAMIFGTRKLRNVGSDLGGAVRGFKEGMKEGASEAAATAGTQPGGNLLEGVMQAKSDKAAAR